MSSLNSFSVPHQFNGDVSATSKINAAELDTQLAAIATQLNAIKAVLDGITRGDDTLGDQIVRSRNLHPEVELAP